MAMEGMEMMRQESNDEAGEEKRRRKGLKEQNFFIWIGFLVFQKSKLFDYFCPYCSISHTQTVCHCVFLTSIRVLTSCKQYLFMAALAAARFSRQSLRALVHFSWVSCTLPCLCACTHTREEKITYIRTQHLDKETTHYAIVCPYLPYLTQEQRQREICIYSIRKFITQTNRKPTQILPVTQSLFYPTSLSLTHTLTFSINLSIFLTELRLCPPDWPRPSSDDLPVCLSSSRSASFSFPSAIRQSMWYWLYVFRAFISTHHTTESVSVSELLQYFLD